MKRFEASLADSKLIVVNRNNIMLGVFGILYPEMLEEPYRQSKPEIINLTGNKALSQE